MRMQKMIIAILSLLLLVSVGMNVRYSQKLKFLENKVYIMKLRLMRFSRITSALVREKGKITLNDLKNSDLLGAPFEERNGYIIEFDPQYDFGIKYLFDKNGRLTGWVEEPQIKFRYKNSKGQEVEKNFKQFVYED